MKKEQMKNKIKEWMWMNVKVHNIGECMGIYKYECMQYEWMYAIWVNVCNMDEWMVMYAICMIECECM